MHEHCKRVLTGNYYFKPTWFGLILYVEVEYHTDGKDILEAPADGSKEFIRARITDLFRLNLVKSPIVTTS